MRLRVLIPDEILLDQEVIKVTAEAINGSFTLLPRHIDFVSALVPSILSYSTGEGEEEFLAINEGILIKCGDDVRVSTPNAVIGNELGKLREMIRERYQKIDENEQKTRQAIFKLEADLVKRFMELNKIG